MAKIGDTVRYLNAVGGGVISRIDGKMAYVMEEGFETPVLLKDIVVVAPAGYEGSVKGASLMFDQKAFEAGKTQNTTALSKERPAPGAFTAPNAPAAETKHGDKLSIALAFEPLDYKQLSSTSFNAVLVNDSNFHLSFSFLRRADDDRGWTLVFQGEIEPNESIDLAQYTHEQLPLIERVCLQATAWKAGKMFELKEPVNIVRKLNLSKFYKLHCFRPGIYFDTPVIEVMLMKEDVVAGRSADENAEAARAIRDAADAKKKALNDAANRLAQKYNVDHGRNSKKNDPTKLLPLIEVDLHIGKLTDNTNGMDNAAMLTMQIDKVSQVMNEHRNRIGQKIVFIHGKGDGVLRKAVLSHLRKNYPKAEIQDASFREYGFGASLVTIH